MTDPSAKAKQRKRTILMTALGVASGVIVSLEIEYSSSFLFETGALSPGLVFGAIFALYLICTKRIGPLEGLGLMVLFTASWMIAYELSAILYIPVLKVMYVTQVPQWLLYPLFSFVLGSVAGLITSALFVLSLFASFGYFRNPRLGAATVFVGALIAGALASLSYNYADKNPFIGFPIWQGVFAYCFAWALTGDDQSRGGLTNPGDRP